MEKYVYKLLIQIDSKLDLRFYSDEIVKIIEAFGGSDIKIFRRRYSFKVPRDMVITNGMKRSMGRQIAKIEGIGCYAYTRYYLYKNGKPAKSSQLFERSREFKFASTAVNIA